MFYFCEEFIKETKKWRDFFCNFGHFERGVTIDVLCPSTGLQLWLSNMDRWALWFGLGQIWIWKYVGVSVLKFFYYQQCFTYFKKMNENKQTQVNTLASVYYFLFHAFANNRPFISDNYHTIKK